MYKNMSSIYISKVLYEPPDAFAEIEGSEEYSTVKGEVYFYGEQGGTLLIINICGIPEKADCDRRFLGFHIHEGNTCTGNVKDPFADAGGHFNPDNNNHPCHAGDLPVLLINNGQAWMLFFTNAFLPEDIIGRTVIIHNMPDDFRTQPAGDSGKRIACGMIEEFGVNC